MVIYLCASEAPINKEIESKWDAGSCRKQRLQEDYEYSVAFKTPGQTDGQDIIWFTLEEGR